MLLLVFVISCQNDSTQFTDLFPVRVNNQYGYIDRKGVMVIPPQYSQASNFVDGLALTGVTGEKTKWGYIDKTGQYQIYPTYIDATIFSEGMAIAVAENGEPVVIDKNGTVKFTVKDAEQVQNFKDELAAYSILTDTGEQWGFIDKEGKMKIEPKYPNVGFFSNGLCPVTNDDGIWGFINKSGTVVIDFKFNEVSDFYNNVARVCIDDKWGIIDKTGKYVIAPQYENIDIDKNKFVVDQNDKYWWIDKGGKTIIESRFARATPFVENKYAAVKVGDKWGYIDHAGNIAINPQFDFAFGFDGDIALVHVNNKFGFIDKTGKIIVDLTIDDVSREYFLNYFAKTSAFNRVTTNNGAPKFIAYKWLTNFFHLKFDEIKNISTEDTKTLLTQFSSLTNMMADSSKQYMMKIGVGIKDCRENNNNATVTYYSSDNPGKLQSLYLVRNEDKWLVQFSKNDAIARSKEDANDTEENNEQQ